RRDRARPARIRVVDGRARVRRRPLRRPLCDRQHACRASGRRARRAAPCARCAPCGRAPPRDRDVAVLGARVIDPARSFDRAAVQYERARPGYPAELLDLLPLGADAEVLDLGAGTGKLTRVLVDRYPRVVAVEPLDNMRAILEDVVPAAESIAGWAESIPVPDASGGGRFAGQALHV